MGSFPLSTPHACLGKHPLVTDSSELKKSVRSKQESVAQEIRTLRSIGSI
jgi:hypothetical protein